MISDHALAPPSLPALETPDLSDVHFPSGPQAPDRAGTAGGLRDSGTHLSGTAARARHFPRSCRQSRDRVKLPSNQPASAGDDVEYGTREVDMAVEVLP